MNDFLITTTRNSRTYIYFHHHMFTQCGKPSKALTSLNNSCAHNITPKCIITTHMFSKSTYVGFRNPISNIKTLHILCYSLWRDFLQKLSHIYDLNNSFGDMDIGVYATHISYCSDILLSNALITIYTF